MAETRYSTPDGPPIDSSNLVEKQDGVKLSASSDNTELKREYPSGLAVTLILTSVTLAYFLFFLDLAVISTATPAITTQFDSLVDVGWYGGAYQLGSAAFQPLSGKIYSQFSIKWTFLVFFVIFEVGSAICGAAHSSAMFIIGRVIAGIGSAGVANGAVTTISAVLSTQKQALFMGLNMGIGQVGLATGPIIGGAFTTNLSWRWCFYINLPLGVVVGGFLLFNTIPEPKPKDPPLQILSSAIKSLDLPGFMLICPAVVMFLLGLQFGGNQYAWDSSVVIGLLVGAGATFVVFLIWEWRQGDNAMVPLTMLKHRVIWSAAMTMFFSLSSILVADFYIAIYFQAIHDDTPLMSGVHMLPITLGIVLFTMISGTLISVLGYYLPFLLMGGVVSSIGYGLMSTLDTTTSVAKWIGYQVLYGVGSGCTTAAPYIAIQGLVAPEQIPIAMAIVIFAQNIGAATSLIAANAIFSNSLRSELQKRATQISVSPDAIINAGVRSIREMMSGSELTAVLEAYAKSIDKVMYLGIAVSIAVLVFSPGLGWKDIRKAKLQAITDKSPDGGDEDLAVAGEK
ncbi:Major facilitator superfamily domain general substrate transporter [Penicillium hordei]|uniref:Major facilitator superfamily domain general substrate transporter n=1 Tax=Penicillium hordei TaxID=40994 RepID=A0AAD6MPB9_9EURO|nr:Major facilitator superfamily domain general substrate transporter [Penicillium hordei]KAJ5618038.1 Major facilitator superfamily domain general substrate transporter [Penicillium hordei]